MIDWDSHNPSPPSLLYPPDGTNVRPRIGLPGTRTRPARNGKVVAIGELRGWLQAVSPFCNGADPDWLYQLEVDLDWMEGLGLAPEAFLQPGDTVIHTEWDADAPLRAAEVLSRTSGRAIYDRPLIKLEVDGWPRFKPVQPDPPKPATWLFRNPACTNKGGSVVWWAFDPIDPANTGRALMVGDYVQVWGSVILDAVHIDPNNEAVRFYVSHGGNETRKKYGEQTAREAERQGISWMWSGGLQFTDAANPGRWNEVHSPDAIRVLVPVDGPGGRQERRETVRCVAVVARRGLFAGDREELTADIRPPPRPSRWHAITHRRHVGPATVWTSIRADEATILADRVRVRAAVEGQGGLGADGKLHVIHRVGWRAVSPVVHAAASTGGRIALGAIDADGATVIRPGATTAPHWPSAWSELLGGRGGAGGHLTLASAAPDGLNAFVIGTDGRAYTAANAGAGWIGWWQIPGVQAPLGAPLHAISRRRDTLDVFMADTAGRVMSAGWEPAAGWHGWWHILGGHTAPGGAVTGVSRRADYLDIVTAGLDGQVWTAGWEPAAGWHGWWAIPGASVSAGAPVAVVSRSADKLDLFVADTTGRVVSAAWEPAAGWRGWWHILGGMTAPGAVVSAVCRRADLLDIFTTGTDRQVWTAAWEPGRGWRGWWSLPGIRCASAASLEAVSPGLDRLSVVATADNGTLHSTSWSPATGWTAWTDIS